MEQRKLNIQEPKKGAAFTGRRKVVAKKESNRKRREDDKTNVVEQALDNEPERRHK